MEHLVTSAAVAVAALFPIMDPIGVVPWFEATTRSWRTAQRRAEAAKPKGVDVLNRIFGLIVLAIAAEMVFHGVSDHFGLHTFE